MEVMLRLFLTKMLVTMIPHSWQQTENHIAWKLGENVAIHVLIWNGKTLQDLGFLTKFLMKSAFLTNERWHF